MMQPSSSRATGSVQSGRQVRFDPEGAEVLDAKGRVVIPGLIDAHIHVSWPQVPWIRPFPIAARRRSGLRTCSGAVF